MEVLYVLSGSSSTDSFYTPLFLWLFSSWTLLPQRLREAKASFLAPEKGRRVMQFTFLVQNSAHLLANVSNRKVLSKLMRNFKVRPRAALHMDNNTQISGVSKLGGSSHY